MSVSGFLAGVLRALRRLRRRRPPVRMPHVAGLVLVELFNEAFAAEDWLRACVIADMDTGGAIWPGIKWHARERLRDEIGREMLRTVSAEGGSC